MKLTVLSWPEVQALAHEAAARSRSLSQHSHTFRIQFGENSRRWIGPVSATRPDRSSRRSGGGVGPHPGRGDRGAPELEAYLAPRPGLPDRAGAVDRPRRLRRRMAVVHRPGALPGAAVPAPGGAGAGPDRIVRPLPPGRRRSPDRGLQDAPDRGIGGGGGGQGVRNPGAGGREAGLLWSPARVRLHYTCPGVVVKAGDA
jgi:hypothetical protein